MIDKLKWHIEKPKLILEGSLNRNTLLPLWKRRHIILDGIRFIDVSTLKNVDSSGVSLMLNFYQHQQRLKNSLLITGVNNQLSTLINLYKLKGILPYELIVKSD